MLRYHMNVITRDGALKRSIKRLTTATGATADFVTDGGQINPTRTINLAIYDARHELPDRRFFAQVPRTARILYIVGGEDLVSRVPLFEDQRVTSLFHLDEQFDDDEFISSATKALRGEIFGLQKYFPWGVTTFTMLVKNYEEKARAIDIMMSYAQQAAVRGPVRDRIQLVADELMMNGLYHAPVDETGQEKYRGLTIKQIAQLPEVAPIQVQYGCSGRYFGVAVRDGGGSLRRERALEYLARARAGAEMEQKRSGAGLGLISTLRSVSKLVFNMAPTYSTEVIGLFDMDLPSHGMVGARSLHLFTADPSSPEVAGQDEEEERAASRVRPGPRASWAVAALVGAAVAGLATAFFLERERTPARASTPVAAAVPAQSPAEVTVFPDPPNSAVTIDGVPVSPGVTVPIVRNGSAAEVEIRVTHPGYRAWSRTILATELIGGERIFVRLDRER
jgi:hypothetical protein